MASIFIGGVWLFFAIGFGYFGLLSFYADASEKGFRATLCGTSGCGTGEFFLNVTWLFGVIFLIYILPIVIIIYLVRRRRKKKKQK
jgi:threonine/homoserine/homoserine lactone efflux protein